MAPDWSCYLELLREMDLLCFCPGKGSHWAGVLTFLQPYSPEHSVCVLSWTRQLPSALLLLPAPPYSSQSEGILGTSKNQIHEQGPPVYTAPGVQAPAHKSGAVLFCVHGDFASTGLFY